jgi:hypothetical protein
MTKPDHHEFPLAAKYRKNLIKLAQGLSGQMPPPEFDMGTYLSFGDIEAARTVLKLGNRIYEDDIGHTGPIPKKAYLSPECGTSACAIGHGPLYGIQRKSGEGWEAYTYRVFLPQAFYSENYELYYTRSDAWQWMFGPQWAAVDNTPKGAAKRIYYFLQHGAPSASFREDVLDSGILPYTRQRPVLV